jgi:hypothetical protein
LPRISSDALAVIPAFKVELPPPGHLGDAEAKVFRDIVATSDHNHFRAEDRELLSLYSVHVVQARRLMKLRRRTAEQNRELRATTILIANLSSKLRLGPKSRAPDNRRAQSAGLKGAFKPPWDETPPVERENLELATRWENTPTKGLGE